MKYRYLFLVFLLTGGLFALMAAVQINAMNNAFDKFQYMPVVLKPLPTAAPTPAPTVNPCNSASNCSCAGNIYNCTDFNTQCQAQACYNKCVSEGRGDIHRLDRDNDGIACENLPRSPIYDSLLFGG